MPIVFNEPLSFLQRISEYMEHTYLINKACSLSDSIERMQVGGKHTRRALIRSVYCVCVCVCESSVCLLVCVCVQAVAAFAVSAVASQWDRTGKPFNPLLGETYELIR